MVVNLASTGSSVSLARSKYYRITDLYCLLQARCYIVNGGGQNVPDWLAAKKKGERRRRHKGDEGQGIHLIQVS
jgi:hypothetical protein